MIKALLFVAAGLLTTQTQIIAPKANQNTAVPDIVITKRHLNAYEARQMARNLGFSFSTKNELKSNYGYCNLVDDKNKEYTTCNSFETNVHYAYSSFTGYLFNYKKSVAETKVTIGTFKSESFCISSTVGVYDKVSFGVDLTIEREIGISAEVNHTFNIGQTISLDGYSDGMYGLMLRFYTCNKLYLKFNGNTLSGGLYITNNPSSTFSYYFGKRGA